MTNSIAWSEIDTKGFVVVPRFYPDDLCDALADDFRTGAPPSAYPHGFKLVSRRMTDRAWKILDPVLAQIRATTKHGVDLLHFLTLSHYIHTSGVERTSYWHQDFDLDYKLTGDHFDYLNFWVPVVKEDPARSNVCLVPFDALESRSPDAYERLVGSGGHRLIPKDGRTLVYGKYGTVLEGEPSEPVMVLDFDIEQLAVTPSLSRGDLLLMRGDVLHRTQDSATERTAASIRATCSRKTITRERALAGRPAAANAGTADPGARIDDLIDRCFAALGKDTITIRELLDFSAGVAPRS